MVLFNMYGVFFWRFLESRNYKIQVIARVGRKSAVVLSGIMEASYSHFFVGQGFDCSTIEIYSDKKLGVGSLQNP